MIETKNIKNLKVAKILFLITAITLTIGAIPGIGYMLTAMTITIYAWITCGLAIASLVLALKVKIGKVAAIFGIIASILGGIAMIMILTSALNLGLDNSGYELSTNFLENEESFMLVFWFILGIIAWILYIVSTILFYISFAKINRSLKEEQFLQAQQNGLYEQQPSPFDQDNTTFQ